MIKIPTLFVRDPANMARVIRAVTPGCEWVVDGHGIATRKFDGTCVLVRGGRLYKRYDAKHGKPPPPNFEAAQPAPDPQTGHWPGWVPVRDGPEDRWHREAWDRGGGARGFADGTYELCGPKIQGNPEHFAHLTLILHAGAQRLMLRHDDDTYHLWPTDYDGLKAAFEGMDIEGVVWHHKEDGRMAKIKLKDFGLTRTPG